MRAFLHLRLVAWPHTVDEIIGLVTRVKERLQLVVGDKLHLDRVLQVLVGQVWGKCGGAAAV